MYFQTNPLYYDTNTAMPCKTPPSKQKNSFSSMLSVPSNASAGILAHHQHFCRGVNYNIIHSEYISLAWNNMASIKSARKLSRAANQAAKKYYQLTFIDDMSEDEEKTIDGENCDIQHVEENDSVHNSKFTFDDDDAWLGSRKRPETHDNVDDYSTVAAQIDMFEKASVRKEEVNDNKISKNKVSREKQNVIGLFMSQVSTADS